MSVVTPQYTTSSVERRRHVRQGAHSIVCVKLDSDNGGILLNLGTRGLSFQAVAPLDPEQDLILHFKLFDTGETIEVAGRVTWLGRTRKEAGICFTDPPDRTMQRISEWIALQETPSGATESKLASPAKPSRVPSQMPLPPHRITEYELYSQAVLPEPEPNLSTALPSAWVLEDALPDSDTSMPIAPGVSATSFPTPIPTLPTPLREHSAASIANSSELSPEPSQTMFQPKLPDPFEFSPKFPRPEGAPPALPNLLSSSVAVFRDKLFQARLALCFAIAVLIVMATGHRKYQESTDSSAAPVLNVSPPTSIAPGGPGAGTTLQSQEMPSHSQPQTTASPAAPSGSVSTHTPIPAPPKIVRRSTEAQLVAMFWKIHLGLDDISASDPALVDVPVWTHGRSGYYYCADSAYFEKLQPGSIMTQTDALQSGYQPKLGSYCH